MQEKIGKRENGEKGNKKEGKKKGENMFSSLIFGWKEN